MLRYLAGRLGLAIPTLLLCTAIVFFVGALTGRSYYEKKLRMFPLADPSATEKALKHIFRVSRAADPAELLRRVDLERVSFNTADAAREAICCVRDDGLTLTDVAIESRRAVRDTRDLLERIANRIINEVRGVNRVA